jgi:hypothetical protein
VTPAGTCTDEIGKAASEKYSWTLRAGVLSVVGACVKRIRNIAKNVLLNRFNPWQSGKSGIIVLLYVFTRQDPWGEREEMNYERDSAGTSRWAEPVQFQRNKI